jgi:hypothetical protein
MSNPARTKIGHIQLEASQATRNSPRPWGSVRCRPRNLMNLAAAVSCGGKGVFWHSCPAATRAQYPLSGVGIFAR